MTIQQLQGYSIFSGLQICGESRGSILFGVPYFGAFVSESSKKTWRNPVLDHCVCFLWSHHNWIAGTVPLKQSGRVQGLLVTTSADSLGCGAFPGRLLAQNQDTYYRYYETLSLLAAPWILTLFSCHFSLIENYRRWAMAVVPLPVPPFPAVISQGAKRWERSTAGCRGCCNWSCRGRSRGGEEKGRRRVQVRVGGREMTNHKMCTFGFVSGYCNNLRHGCWNDDIHWYPIFT